MLRYLLDTNIVIYVLKRRPIEVLATLPGAERKATPGRTGLQLWSYPVGQRMAVRKKFGKKCF